MLMNNGQNTRSYSPVPTEVSVQRAREAEDPKEKLRELVRKQLAHEVVAALTLADLAGSFWKMGLEGHKHKLYYMAVKEFKENFDWRKYYHDTFNECPRIEVEYQTKEVPKSIDEVHNRLYELHMKNKENLVAILKLTTEHHMYSDMKLLLAAYSRCEEHEEELGSRMKRAQVFGYDVAHILERDRALEDEHIKCKMLKEKHEKERQEHMYYHK